MNEAEFLDHFADQAARATPEARQDIRRHTTDIVAAYVARNPLGAGELPALIATVHQALRGIASGATAAPDKPKPAVPIGRSIRPDHLICLEDGKRLKMLKRHLRAAYNLTPEQYRAKWRLPHDYPMVAPEYARARSDLAKQTGLGLKGGPRRRRGR